MNPTLSTPRRTLIDLVPRANARATSIARDAALVVGFAIFTALLAQVRITLGFTPVPITGQTLAVLLSGAALGWRRGALSQVVYWAAGIFMPVAWYANDKTGSSVSKGWHAATGTTAGYLLGFVVAAALVGFLAERGQDRDLATSVPAMLAGTAIIYVCGAVWLAHELHIPVANGDANALAFGVTPFLIGDAIKLCLAGALTPLAWKFAGNSADRAG
jgi:biotin transport system substrate-specific component